MIASESLGRSVAATAVPIAAILTFEYHRPLLPLGGIYLALYALILFCATVWLSWMTIQHILKRNAPYSYEKNAYLKLFKSAYSLLQGKDDVKSTVTTDDLAQEQRNIDERITDFTRDVERFFILKWYPKITPDDIFPAETRNLLDTVVRRFLQIVVQVDHKKLVHGMLIIILKHIKEFRKCIKRRENSSKAIEEIYRYAHIASKNDKAFEHFICQITTKMLRQFLSWELYSSVPCKCLVSILARKLTSNSLVYISAPQMINYRIAQVLFSRNTKADIDFGRYNLVYLNDLNLVISENKTDSNIEVEKKHFVHDEDTPKVMPKRENSENGKSNSNRESDKIAEQGKDEVDSNHAVSAPVKIYKSQSNRTWRNSSDLECISLGEDLLMLQEFNDPDLQIQDLIDKKPWRDNTDSLEVEDKPQHSIWNITENIEEVLESKDLGIPSPNIPSFLSNTIKPIGNVTASTLHNMKEFQQSTVNNVVKPVSQATSTAMHKIGDLQDEAAGVMEGIFDFGMAGIRKGLRLTGLQDHPQVDKAKMETGSFPNRSSQQKTTSKLTKTPHVNSENSSIADESPRTNPLLICDSPNNFDGHILLEKSPVVVVEDATSPEPEYEDAPDLATTTAKLRSLLQQKTSESNATTPAVSPIPFSDEVGKLHFTTPVEFTGRCSDQEVEVDGALPSLYKFCARTATGVFQNTLNTIKTALPGNTADHEHRHEGLIDKNCDSENWMYVASDPGIDDFSNRTRRLLNERKAFCTVDNAYEAVEAVELTQIESSWTTPPSAVYEDELDELEVRIPFTKTLVDIFCELASETNTFLTRESVVKMTLILFGELSEDFISGRSEKITRKIGNFIGKFPEEAPNESLHLPLEDFVRHCLETFPGFVKTLVGEDTITTSLKVLLMSFRSHKINQDVALQLFELFTSLLIEAGNKMTPAYSA